MNIVFAFIRRSFPKSIGGSVQFILLCFWLVVAEIKYLEHLGKGIHKNITLNKELPQRKL